MNYQKYQLKNKTAAFLIPLKDTQSVTVLVMFPVGSRYEAKETSGISHLIEHLMFKGTKKRPNTLVLTREIDRLGAEYNAFTSKEYTGYYIKTDAKYLETSLDILSDMLFNSKFATKEMIKEKKVIVEEIRMYNDNPIMRIEQLFESLFYKGSLGADTGGTEQTVMSMERQVVLDYRKKYYQPNNITVIVAGKYDIDIKNKLNKYFSLQKNIGQVDKKFVGAELGVEKKDQRILVENKKTDQIQLMIGFPALNYLDEENIPLAVLNTVFGGSMSSRLFIQVRERRGLAYFIRSGAENFRDAGYFYVRVGLEAKNINKALQVIKNEMKKIVSRGITAKELKDAKTHIRGALTLSLEDSSAQANWYARQALFMDEIKTPEEKLKELEQVANKGIKMLAKKIFDWNKIRIAVIGDIKKEEINF